AGDRVAQGGGEHARGAQTLSELVTVRTEPGTCPGCQNDHRRPRFHHPSNDLFARREMQAMHLATQEWKVKVLSARGGLLKAFHVSVFWGGSFTSFRRAGSRAVVIRA